MAIQAKFCSENLGFALGAPEDSLMENFMQNQFQNPNSHLQKKQRFLVENSQSISSYIQKQSMEIDHFITFQNERLKFALQEQRKQQMGQVLNKYESRTRFLLLQKEEEITKAKNRAMELEQYIKRIEMENQTWQKLAKENEEMVVSLNMTIERMRETAITINGVDDAESCCENQEIKEEEEKMMMKMVICKCCNVQKSCVLMLPCRHFCSCKDCDVFLDFCPVCSMVKKDSIEAFI